MRQAPLLAHRTAFLAGAFVPERRGSTFVVHNPATTEVLAELPSYGREETVAAIDAAAWAMREPLLLEERRTLLHQIVQVLEHNRDALATLITRENGKPLAESLAEITYAAGFFAVAADSLEVLVPRIVPGNPRGLSWTVHARPAGVAALITPWNFPIAMLAKKLSAAIAAGCASVVKPSELTPLSSLALFSLLAELPMPKGFVNLVFGDAPAIGLAMSEHPAVRVLSFTGSTRTGQLLAAQAAPKMKKLALELGGNAPFIVFDDASIEDAVEGLMTSKFRAAGQTCVCPNRVYVQEPVIDQLAGLLTERVRGLRVGDGLEAGVEVGPLIHAEARDKVERLVKDAVGQGATVLTGGKVVGDSRGSYYQPTVLRGVRDGMAILREECFGPVVPLVTFASEEEVIAAANATEYGLAAYVYSGDEARADRVVAQLRFGHVGVNTGAGPTPEAPFGGMKFSGVGREGGVEGVLEFVEFQTVPRPLDRA